MDIPKQDIDALENHIEAEKRDKTMTKAELIDKIAGSVGFTKADATKSLDAMIDSIEGALKKGQKLKLVGFGTFSVSKRKARKGRNPKTSQEIKIPATKVPKFKAGKGLKEIV